MVIPKPEGEYFTRVEAEKKKEIAKEKRKKLSREEMEKLKSLHWMCCPKCGMELHPVPFKDVTLDKCFHCHGVYLDDGEFEKIAGQESGFVKAVLSLFRS